MLVRVVVVVENCSYDESVNCDESCVCDNDNIRQPSLHDDFVLINVSDMLDSWRLSLLLLVVFVVVVVVVVVVVFINCRCCANKMWTSSTLLLNFAL